MISDNYYDDDDLEEDEFWDDEDDYEDQDLWDDDYELEDEEDEMCEWCGMEFGYCECYDDDEDDGW